MTLPSLRRDDARPDWTPEQTALVKRTIAKGCDDDELALFMHICQRTGLDPFAKQIYAIRRWDSKARREVMTPQTSIDGYRLVAERTGRYAPGREPTLTYDAHDQLETATSYVKKQTPDGTWHEVAATAHFAEYAQVTKEGTPTKFWQQMPRVMLSKVAEALALRRAFPADLSGIYTHEEMAQADTGTELAPASPAALPAPRRASASASPAPSVAGGAPAEPEELVYAPTADEEQLTLDGELSDEEKYGRLATAKEIRALMGALTKAGKSTDELKQFCLATFGIRSRTQLRVGMLVQLGTWLERMPGEEG
jgi:phage recombination protein Bet